MLEDHFDYMHTNKPKKYRCKPCTKTFEQKKVYLEHNRRLHNNSDYKYVCDECGRVFFVKGEFTCHRLSHTGVKPFASGVCNVACFATPGRLNAHLAKCGKPLAFQCDLCGKHFSSKQAVVRTHSRSTCDPWKEQDMGMSPMRRCSLLISGRMVQTFMKTAWHHPIWKKNWRKQ